MRRIPALAYAALLSTACNDATEPQPTIPAPAATAQPSYDEYQLVDLQIPGGDSEALGINRHGLVIGVGSGGAYLWTHGVVTSLGTLGGAGTRPHAINDKGQVVGLSNVASGQLHAFLWTAGVMLDLGHAGDRVHINERGQVAFTRIVEGGRRATLWDRGRLVDLGTLDGTAISVVRGLNDRGEVAGVSADKAFLWSRGQLLDLGRAGTQVDVVGVNDRGHVAGTAHYFPPEFPDARARAWAWRGVGLEDLGDVPAQHFSNNVTAVGINRRGEITGTALTSTFEPGVAFVWRAGVMQASANGLCLPGPCSSPVAINDAGAVIGYSGHNTSGRVTWPWVWRGESFVRLPALSGSSQPTAINARGEVAGWARGPAGQRSIVWRPVRESIAIDDD